MYMRKFISVLFLVFILLSAGCIKNDIPYPRIVQYITAISAVGEVAPAIIDNENFQVTISLGEDVDIHNVSFSQFSYTKGAEVSVNLLEGEYDLSQPLKIKLSKYQDYEWIVSASQVIDRYFSIAGQIGETVIDEIGHRIVVYVPDNFDITNLEVTAIKLGPENNTVLSPEFAPGRYDFSRPVHIKATSFGKTVTWSVYVEISKAIITTTHADAWSNIIWVYGNAPEDSVNGFQYKVVGDSEWIDVPQQYVTISGGSFSAYIPHLKPLTQYVVRACSGENIANEIVVETEDTMVLPDASFDQWWLDGKVWNPWNETGIQFWDTGNTGAATLGQSNVQPSNYTPSGIGRSALLETKFVGIGSIGKLAAGSIYTGVFRKVDGTNGILGFGRPWNSRPTKLKGYFQYKTAPINYASSEFEALKGRPDTCHIYVALTDWTEPFEIRTNPNRRQLFDKNSPSVIAYGELLYSGTMDSWKEFEIKLEYRSTSRRPSYIQITAAASKYGDYFTGGAGAILYVDDFSLDYDY